MARVLITTIAIAIFAGLAGALIAVYIGADVAVVASTAGVVAGVAGAMLLAKGQKSQK